MTQTNAAGRSTFACDDESSRRVGFPAYPQHPALDIIWATASRLKAPLQALDITARAPFIPPPGATTFFVNVSMPDSVIDGLSKKEVEQNFMAFIEQVPEFGPAFDLSRLGMHRTNTIEYGYVISGQVYLEVDSGDRKLLTPGDTWVNNAAMHAWRNPFDQPCVSIITMQGIKGPRQPLKAAAWKVKHALWTLINRNIPAIRK